MTKCVEILKELNIEHQLIEGHEPIVDYEAAKRVDEKYHLEGMESKCLLMKTKSSKMVLFVTHEGVRMNRQFFKELLNEKVSIFNADELGEYCGYVAGCLTPFAYPDDLIYIVDNSIFNHEKFICSAGTLTDSFVMYTNDLKFIYEKLGVNVTYVDYPNE